MDAADDGAIAPDKVALLPGQTPGVANVTGYSRGINGVMIDVAGMPAAAVLTPADFAFEAFDASGALATGAGAPGLPAINVRRGAGVGGSDRVTITWPANAVRNGWLRVTLLATPRTGLAAPDVFTFGNLAGDTGDGAAAPFHVNALDLGGVKRALNGTSTLTGRFDFNRDGRVNALDLGIAKANLNRSLSAPVAPTASVVAAPPFPATTFSETGITALHLFDTPAVLPQ
jgi:hypothetical protein